MEQKPTQCPKCGSPLKERDGKYGKFLGCSAYPDCKFIWNYPREEPQQEAPQPTPQATQSPPDAPKPQKGSYTQIQLEIDIETIKNAVMRIEALVLKQFEPEDEVNTDGL